MKSLFRLSLIAATLLTVIFAISSMSRAYAAASVRIESNAPAASPTCTPTNIILDGGFETGGIPSSIWNDPQSSTNFGTPLCDNATCGTGSGAAPPRTGQVWAWFGGIPSPETARVGQSVTIPAGVSASLRFWMRIGTVTALPQQRWDILEDRERRLAQRRACGSGDQKRVLSSASWQRGLTGSERPLAQQESYNHRLGNAIAI